MNELHVFLFEFLNFVRSAGIEKCYYFGGICMRERDSINKWSTNLSIYFNRKHFRWSERLVPGTERVHNNSSRNTKKDFALHSHCRNTTLQRLKCRTMKTCTRKGAHRAWIIRDTCFFLLFARAKQKPWPRTVMGRIIANAFTLFSVTNPRLNSIPLRIACVQA